MLHFGVLLGNIVGAFTAGKWLWSWYVSGTAAETTERPLGAIHSVDE